MAINQSLIQLRASVRKFADAQGTTALLRHPDADVNDYINRALGSLHRRLTTALPDQRFLASTTVTTEADVSTYSLPSAFDFLISVELLAEGRRTWLLGYEMHERPQLVRTDVAHNGIPFTYRLRGENIELLPVPQGEYEALLWYVPSATQLTGDAQVFDTISRLDDYLVAYASRLISIKDKNWDLRDACAQVLAELESEIDLIGRNRDRNSPPRITDVYLADRWGRTSRARR